jgi:septal ring factor EnvC (AmiA/AmiB activator)
MTDKEEKKGIFKKAAEALSSKDEKETIAKLEAELKASQDAVKSLLNQNLDAKKDSSAELKEAEAKIAQMEAQLKAMKDQQMKETKEDRMQGFANKKAMVDAELKPKIITVHTVESNNQTLSHVALKYYKHATPPYWQYLLEHNKEVLGGSEKNIRMGMKLEIPELPDDLKE